MASDAKFVEFVLDQLSGVDASSRKMFGEFAIYGGGKVVALICGNQLFFKPTEAGRRFIGNPVETPAYPGAKPSFLIEGGLDDATWMRELLKVTVAELPETKAKATRPARPAAKRNTKSRRI